MLSTIGRLFVSFIILHCVLATNARAQTPVHLWSQRFGGLSGDGCYGVAVDGSGNIFLAGQFSNTVNFGGGNLVSAGSSDIFIAKYNSSGVHQWSQRFGSTLSDIAYGVALDGAGNVLLAGYFENTVNFGGGNLISAGSTDIFVAKYNSAGVHQWSQRFGSTTADGANGVAADVAGNVAITGAFTGMVNFGGGNLVSAGSNDAFLALYNSAGVHQWSQRFGLAAADNGRGVAMDAFGNVFATGDFQSDVYLVKFATAGVYVWDHVWGSGGFDAGRAVAADASGNILLTGSFNGTVNFGGPPLTTAGAADIFVAKYDTNGDHLWSRSFGSTVNDFAFGIAADASDNVSVTGYFEGTVSFGGPNLVGAGNQDIFLARFTPAGVHRWSQRFGNTAVDNGNAVTTDAAGNVFAAGFFIGTANFGAGNVTSAGGSDIFVAKYTPDSIQPLAASIVDVGNDQGRSVKISFYRSQHDDATSSTPVVQYEAFRRDDPVPAPAREAQSLAAGWIFAGSVPAHRENEYLMIVPTLIDSTLVNGSYFSTFYIRAATSNPGIYFDSPPDSGYSVDNLSPGVPTNFTYNSGDLVWEESQAADFDYFTVYGSNTESFGTATLIDYTVEPEMDVSASAYAYYFVTATDVSGNEGLPAVVNTLSGVGGTPNRYVLSLSAYPNPFNPATTIRYTLPSGGRVAIRVYDARGALVSTLVEEEKSSGAYVTQWNGRNAAGAIAGSGVYFARVMHPSGTRSYKLVLLK